jgi:hypothetical protein
MTLQEHQADQGFSRIHWHDPKRGPWGIQAMWVTIDGRPECVGLTLWRGADQGNESHLSYSPIPGQLLHPITATSIHELPIATIIDQLRDAARAHWREVGEDLVKQLVTTGLVTDPTWAEILAPSAFEASPKRAGAPVRYDLAHYVQVAEAYLDAWQVGRKPTRDVAQQFGVTQSTAAKWIAKVRGDKYQLLTPTTHGRPGAEPGPGLLKLREPKATNKSTGRKS